MLLLDERRAIEAIPAMLDRDPELASRMTDNLGRMIEVVGVQSRTSKVRLAEIEALFESRGPNGQLLPADEEQLDQICSPGSGSDGRGARSTIEQSRKRQIIEEERMSWLVSYVPKI